MMIVSLRKSTQKIVCYFVVDTWALAKWWCSHHLRTWYCPMPQNFVTIRSINYKIPTWTYSLKNTKRRRTSNKMETKLNITDWWRSWTEGNGDKVERKGMVTKLNGTEWWQSWTERNGDKVEWNRMERNGDEVKWNRMEQNGDEVEWNGTKC
jgi:hypothetical protein